MTFSRLFLYGAFLCLVACGGGGGGGSSGRPFDPPADTAPPLDYNGVTARATLTTANSGHFVFDLLTDSRGNPQSITAGNNGNVPRAFQRYFEADGPRESSVDCVQGSVDYYVDIEGDGTGTVHIDNKNCDDLNGEIDGLLILKILEVDPIYATEHATMKFNRLTTSGDGFNTINSGSVEFEEFADNNRRRLTLNVVMEETNSGRRFRLSDMVFDRRYEDYAGSDTYTESISGRLYDSEYGYVDVTTLKRIEYESGFSLPVDGELRFDGANGSRLIVEFLGGLNVTVRLDVNGDDVDESSAAINLAPLAFPENADIGDTDGDGMHNSWESYYGLNPDDPEDASLDGDADLRSNLGEYRTGTRPNDADSQQPVVDVELRVPSEKILPAGMNSSLTIGVRVDDFSMGNVVQARAVLPPEFDIQSVSEGCEIEANTVTCVFREPYNFIGAGLTVNFIAPVALGTYNYEASAYSSLTFDPDESNNAANGQVEVLPATAELAAAFLNPSEPVPTIHNLGYTFEIENTGVLPAVDVQAELELPEGVTFIGAFPGSICSLSDRILNCYFGVIDPGTSQNVVVSAAPPATLGTVTATLNVTSDTAELNLADNTDEQSNEIINPISDAFLASSAFTSGPIGGEWDLAIAPDSAGPHYLPEVQVTIDLPLEIEFVSVSSVFGNVVECAGPDPVVCTTPLSSSSAAYRSFTLRLRSSTAGIYEYMATIASAGEDPDLSDNIMAVSSFVGQPVDSIQAQIDAAADGDTVEVPAGYYWGNLNYSKSINLVAVDGVGNTYWSEEFSGIHVSDTDSGEITGFTFTHGRTAPVWLTNGSIRVHGNIFQNIRSQSITAAGVMISGLSSPIVESNIMRNISCSFLTPQMIRIQGSGMTTIRNNVFSDNDCIAIDALGVSMIVNNSFSGNDAAIEISSFALESGAYVENNIFVGNGIAIETVCGANCGAIHSNLLYGNDQDFVNMLDSGGNIFADPMLTDAANGDYTLQPGSPAIDAGDALNAPANDFNGNPRPVDGDGSGTAEPDIGAYEVQ